jgi:CDP-diglyceride synthetase
MGAPATIELRTVKKWWVVLWVGLTGFYLWSALLFATSTRYLVVLVLIAIFNGISTSATAMLYLNLRDNRQVQNQESAIVFCSVFFLVMISTLLSNMSSSPPWNFAGFIGQVLSWIFFVLMAWNYRKQHMATTILLLVYANLQLPAGLVGKEGWGNDFVLLLAAKLSLIGAMYHTLGIRDAKS